VATSLQRAADTIVQAKTGKSLDEWLREQVAPDVSYETIARRLFAVTDEAVTVSYSTVKRWLDEAAAVAGAA
jgi:hypothetical protein